MGARRKKLLLVDGYNVLRSGERYQSITADDFTDDWFNVARDALINDVLTFVGCDTAAVIVFDGGDNPYSTGDEMVYGPVTVRFSPAGATADKVIEKLAFRAKAAMIPTQVVTSDSSIQSTVFGGGVERMSARDFSREMAETLRQARLDETPKIARKNTLAERIDPAALARLVSLRDGK